MDYEKLTNATPGEPSHAIRDRVEAARMRQRERLETLGMTCNAHMEPAEIRTLCVLRENAQALMRTAMRQMQNGFICQVKKREYSDETNQAVLTQR